ncbi:MAG: hypothetical protein LUJ09_04170 [Firmicutes bacterium]|nr:hypothetical protein [Bacillota bacterium]
MKIWMEMDNGEKIPVRELEGTSKDTDTLLIQFGFDMHPAAREDMEAELSERIGKKCVILPYRIVKIWGV